MKIGIPKGLMYYKYNAFIKTFFEELGCDIVTSPDTNKEILNLGVKYSVDEACLPIKVFHGHVAWLQDKCDLLVVPRIMQLREREYICPKFCGLPEMIINSIPNLPTITMEPIYAYNNEKLFEWCCSTVKHFNKTTNEIKRAFYFALKNQSIKKSGIRDCSYSMNIALAGHPYVIYDNFINMNVVKKLNKYGIGVITEEFVNDNCIDKQVSKLFKRPFWTFARNLYGATTYLAEKKLIDGVVYISSFGCGIDSVVIELIKEKTEHLPFMTLKLDEQTGEAGVDTRLEAFCDMLSRGKERFA